MIFFSTASSTEITSGSSTPLPTMSSSYSLSTVSFTSPYQGQPGLSGSKNSSSSMMVNSLSLSMPLLGLISLRATLLLWANANGIFSRAWIMPRLKFMNMA